VVAITLLSSYVDIGAALYLYRKTLPVFNCENTLLQKRPNGRFDEPQSAKYIKQMASALKYCHNKKVKESCLHLQVDYQRHANSDSIK
jgi:serine/threonine protein kinase